jgi:hypothetical protein
MKITSKENDCNQGVEEYNSQSKSEQGSSATRLEGITELV